MAKQPTLRMTGADYVVIAVSPALIMALVGSLVFFLIEVLYVGQYQARLNYVFALFVFATVLIGRISIEMGADRAALFALPLAIAMFLVLAKFVSHASPYSHLINIALLGVVWWSTHKLTWDCTLIDDNQDASGEGLMQRIGVDELFAENEPGSAENELLADNAAEKTKTPHAPGLWVLYYSLAALPLFGIGQKWIAATDVGRRQYVFGLLAVYVASGLTLLVTTSFLGLRRYLRQRRVEMPTPMAATWVVAGGVLIAVVMLLAALIPRPQAEYFISEVPWQAYSPSDLASSRMSFGNNGTQDKNDDDNGRRITKKETDSGATATREGDNPTSTSEQGKKRTSGGEKSDTSEASPGKQSEQGEQSGSSESPQTGDPSKERQAEQQQSEQRQTPRQQSEQPQSKSGDNSSKSSQDQPSELRESAEQLDRSSNEVTRDSPSQPREEDSQTQQRSKSDGDSASDSPSNPLRSPLSLPNLSAVVGGSIGLLKLIFYAALALALGCLAWQNRRQITLAIADILHQLRDLLARLLGGDRAKPTNDADDEMKKISGPPQRLFSSFADPFASGHPHSMPPDELVQYTFEAFEAWARERGFPRSPDQTLLEIIWQAVPKRSPLMAEARLLARLYNEAAYAPGSISTAEVDHLAPLWTQLRRTSQTPLEPAS